MTALGIKQEVKLKYEDFIYPLKMRQYGLEEKSKGHLIEMPWARMTP